MSLMIHGYKFGLSSDLVEMIIVKHSLWNVDFSWTVFCGSVAHVWTDRQLHWS